MDPHVSALLDAQGVDGGWGYQTQSTSWTEPTAFCLLALRNTEVPTAALARGEAWLLRTQRPDGGWAPQKCIDESTWVTSLAVLALGKHGNAAPLAGGQQWLLRQTGRQTTTIDRLRGWLARQSLDTTPSGWPWYPATASWVIPTSMSILALRPWSADGEAKRRIDDGREFLLARQCADGGWNHGGSRILSENAQSYPETTGIALMALQGVPAGRLAGALKRAEILLTHCESNEGTEWLKLGLAAHARPYLSIPRPGDGMRVCRPTIPAMALQLISSQQRNIFLS